MVASEFGTLAMLVPYIIALASAAGAAALTAPSGVLAVFVASAVTFVVAGFVSAQAATALALRLDQYGGGLA